MNEDQIEQLKLWINEKPGYITYKEAVEFLKDYLDSSKSEAEIQLAKLQRDDEIVMVKTSRTKHKETRIFPKPLPDLTESHIRSTWDGSSGVEQSADIIVESVHDKTGHPKEAIAAYLEHLSQEGKCDITGGVFRWIE